MITLYKHQEEFCSKPPDKKLLCWGTGTGKTLTSIESAHRYAEKILVISPKVVKNKWIKEIQEHGTDKKFIVCSKEEFRTNYQKIPPCDMIVADECFVAGTKVLTKNGYKNIEDIVTGEEVKNAYGYGTVEAKSESYSNDIVIIKLKNGKKIKCTPNHPFLTNKGWKKAIEINTSNVLLHYLCDNDIIKTYEYRNNETLFNMQNSNDYTKKEPAKKILLEQVHNATQLEYKQRKNVFVLARKLFQKKSRKSKKSFRKNDRKQSNVQLRVEKKSKRYIIKNRTQTKSSWRKWKRDAYSSKSFTFGSWGRLVRRTCNTYKILSVFRKKLSSMLQNRYSKSKKNDSNRSRRCVTFFRKSKNSRQQKNNLFRAIGVESIQIQKQGSSSKFRVYNLQISGHPSYVVEDVIVHNCHFFSGMKSQMSKALEKYIKVHNPKYILGLTATPYMSTPWNIYRLATLLGHKWNYLSFESRFFNMIRMGGRIIPVIKKDAEIEIAELVKEIGNVLSLDECVDVPEQTFEVEYVAKTKEQEKAIQQIQTSGVAPIALFTKIHQILNGTLKSDGYVEDEFFETEKIDRILAYANENNKIAVICRYNLEIDNIKNHLEKDGKKVFVLRGDTKDRDTVIKEAESCDKGVILISAGVSEGYELPSFGVVIFSSLDFSYKNYKQMVGRFLRINKLKKNIYIHLVIPDSIDEKVYEAMTRKQDFDIAIYTKSLF